MKWQSGNQWKGKSQKSPHLLCQDQKSQLFKLEMVWILMKKVNMKSKNEKWRNYKINPPFLKAFLNRATLNSLLEAMDVQSKIKRPQFGAQICRKSSWDFWSSPIRLKSIFWFPGCFRRRLQLPDSYIVDVRGGPKKFWCRFQ